MLTPTMFTVTTRHSASLREFHTYLGMLPAKKKRMTASGSVTPSAFFTVKICVSVFRHGNSMKPKNRYTKNAIPKVLASRLGLNHEEALLFMRQPP